MAVAPQPTHQTARLDGVAISASTLCLVHCLALPFVASSVPVLGLLTGHEELVHWLLLMLAVPVGLRALGNGRRRAGPWPLGSGVIGFALMVGAVAMFAGDPLERWLTVCGVMIVAFSHVANWRAGRHGEAGTERDR